MSATFKLDGKMIPRSVKRMFDERREPRNAAHAAATMEHRGRRHDVAIANISRSGAMVIFASIPHIGDKVTLYVTGHGPLPGEVRWVRDGRVGVTFDAPLD